MHTSKLNKYFNVDIFVILSVVTMGLNSIGWFRISSVSQLSAMAVAAYGLISISISIKEKTWDLQFSGWQISFLITLASFLSFAGNGFSYATKNIYSTLSVFINFFIFYAIAFNRPDNKLIIKVLKFIVIFTIIVAVVNITFYVFNISIPVKDYVDIKDSQFIGVDIVRHRFTGLSANANGLARVSLSSILAFFMLSTMVSFDKKMTAAMWFFSTLNVLIIFLSQSRGTINAMFVFFIFVLMTHISQRRFIKQRTVNMILTVALAGVLVLGSIYIGPKISGFAVNSTASSNVGSSIVDRGENDVATNNDVSNGRFTLIKNGINATIEKNLFFGLSYSGNAKQIQNYLDEHNIEVPYYIYDGAGSMHNTVVQSFVNTGLIGLIVMLFFLFRSIYTTVKMTFYDIVSDSRKLAVMNGVFASLFLLNMVEWVFYFDFSNHFVNFLLMFTFGWYSYTSKLRKSEQL